MRMVNLRALAGLVVLAGCLPAQAEAPVLAPGDRARLTIRWVVEDGYYLEDPPSRLVFSAPIAYTILPEAVETRGKVMGEYLNAADIAVSAKALNGRHETRIAAEIFFCSVREKWCKTVKRELKLPVEIGRRRGAPNLELEILVPLEEEK